MFSRINKSDLFYVVCFGLTLIFIYYALITSG